MNDSDVSQFLLEIEDDKMRADSLELLKIMEKITGEPARMWGSAMIGFGSYHYKYASGREGDWFRTGFSPRKKALSIYIMAGLKNYKHLLSELGKHKTGKSCLYVKRLEDINLNVLNELLKTNLKDMGKMYPVN
ncbi:MAG: DUF1801 domain-containing protein [Fulvivirga sp.]|nr:DUF1801 domain-containing protein [Fulvivirga sp.]